MTVRQPRYSKEEFARRGDKIYESQVRSPIEDNREQSLKLLSCGLTWDQF
jgi:hypothetical protein